MDESELLNMINSLRINTVRELDRISEAIAIKLAQENSSLSSKNQDDPKPTEPTTSVPIINQSSRERIEDRSSPIPTSVIGPQVTSNMKVPCGDNRMKFDQYAMKETNVASISPKDGKPHHEEARKKAVANQVSKMPTPVPFAAKASKKPLAYLSVPYDEPVSVQFSHIYSSRNFNVHLDYDKVTRFCSKVNALYSDGSMSVPLKTLEIKMKMLCCIFNENEGTYYRAQIIKESDIKSKYIVNLVDFGEIVSIDLKFIFPLDPLFKNIPILAVNCFLEDNWSKDYTLLDNFLQQFFDITIEENFQLQAKFKEPLEGDKFPVTLSIRTPKGDWQNIHSFVKENYAFLSMNEDVLKSFFNFDRFLNDNSVEYSERVLKAYNVFLKKTVHLKTDLRLNRSYRVTGPWIHDVSNFVVIFKELPNQNGEMVDLESFATNMNFFYKNALIDAIESIEHRALLVFKLGTAFFRGLVLKQRDGFGLFLSVDYGFLTVVHSSDVFRLFSMFTLNKFPMFSLLVGMDNVNSFEKDAAVELFQTIIRKKEFDLKPIDLFDDRYSVELYIEGMNINGVLSQV